MLLSFIIIDVFLYSKCHYFACMATHKRVKRFLFFYSQYIASFYQVSLKIPGFPSFEYGYSLWTAVGATLGALSSAIISTYESCCKKIKNEEGTKEGPSQAKQTISTYV